MRVRIGVAIAIAAMGLMAPNAGAGLFKRGRSKQEKNKYTEEAAIQAGELHGKTAEHGDISWLRQYFSEFDKFMSDAKEPSIMKRSKWYLHDATPDEVKADNHLSDEVEVDDVKCWACDTTRPPEGRFQDQNTRRKNSVNVLTENAPQLPIRGVKLQVKVAAKGGAFGKNKIYLTMPEFLTFYRLLESGW